MRSAWGSWRVLIALSDPRVVEDASGTEVLRNEGTYMPQFSALSDSKTDVVVVGGGGHVGLPLAIAFADRGASVVVHDISDHAVALVNAGVLPFLEPGAEPKL